MPENICVGCGMCCDGTLFSRVSVGRRDDHGLLERLGFVLEADDEQTWFPQPCRAVADGCCTVYSDRPRTCRGFRCELLKRHEDEGFPADDARALIAKATTLRDRIRSGMADVLGDTGHMSMGAMQQALHGRLETADDRARHTQLLLDLASLNLVVRRHFENPSTANETSAEQVAP